MRATIRMVLLLWVMCLLLPAAHANSDRQLVSAQKYFTFYKGARYPSPAAACNAWVLKEYPDGSYVSWAGDQETNDELFCFYRLKDGTRGQYAVVQAELDCPANATFSHADAIRTRKCECDEPLVAKGNQCVEKGASTGDTPKGQTAADDKCPLDKLKGEVLKNAVVESVTSHMNAAHNEFVRKPALAMDVLTDKEVFHVFGGGGGYSGAKMTPGAFKVLYGHAVERLTGRRVTADTCLMRYVTYLDQGEQMKPGTNPDFKGKGRAAGLEIDITTEESRAKKQKSAAKARYEFITYTRRLQLNSKGRAVPL